MRWTSSPILAICCIAACSEPTVVNGLPDSRFEILDGGNCARDKRTSLVWERKSDDGGLTDWRNTYSWFDPDETVAEQDYRGTEDGGSCVGSACDTWHYVEAVNAARLCGQADWRLPLRDELGSISDQSRDATPPTTNINVFPLTRRDEYWSGNDYSFRADAAWAWNFEYGHDRVDWKKAAKALRLVRGAPRNPQTAED